MRYINLIVLMSFLLSSTASAWSPLWSQQRNTRRITLGVVPFSAAGVEEYEAIALASRLRSELVNTRKFNIVETEKIEAIIKEQAFHQTGVINEKNVIKVGKMLGAQLMITGAVGRVGRDFTVEIYVTDVRTRRIVLAKSGTIATKAELLDFMRLTAYELANKKSGEKKSGKKWLWIVSGAALIGGGVAAIIFANDADKTNSGDVIGTPPEPPVNQ